MVIFRQMNYNLSINTFAVYFNLLNKNGKNYICFPFFVLLILEKPFSLIVSLACVKGILHSRYLQRTTLSCFPIYGLMIAGKGVL